MRRVLVTGVTGFAGSHLVDYLLTRGDCEIVGIQRWRSRTENIEHFRDRITLLECDLRDAASTRDTLEKVKPDWIFHLAAQSFVPTSWIAPTESLTTNVLCQVNLFEAVRRLGLKCRIQLACSSEEYGMVLPGVMFVGNLEAKRDFTDVRDMVRAYWLALEKCEPGEVYNLCRGRAWSIQEVLDLLLGMTKAKIEVRQDPARLRPSDVPILLGDNSKFRKATGWEPAI